MARYSRAVQVGGHGTAAIDEFRALVKEAHRLGIEVILDVVFNHTAEGNECGPSVSFRSAAHTFSLRLLAASIRHTAI